MIGLLFAAASFADLPPYVERALADWGVPGAAIAVVQDDRLVLLQGFGVRAMGRPEPVGPRTVFALGSLSKGFTTAALATLVGEGTLGWDDRLADLVPGFAVADPWITREITVRDLLAHRTGWTERLDVLWALEKLPREEILARLPHVTQGAPFRAGETYHNVTYLLASEAAVRKTGLPWGRLLRERVLGPLGMVRTFPTLAEARVVEDRAGAHSDAGGSMRSVEEEDGDAVAPAAGVQSTAEDLGRWLRFQLGRGALEGHRLYPETVADEMHTPQTVQRIGAWHARTFPQTHLVAWGLGWVVQDYRGRKVVWNTGGMGGASCSIAFMPEERFGVAVLTNGARTSLPEALVWRALDRALGAPDRDWSAVRLARSLELRRAGEKPPHTATPPSHPLEAYAGSYTDPLLGTLSVATEGERLRAALGALRGTLQPWEGETLRIAWDESAQGTSLATFGGKGVEIEDLGSFERSSPAGGFVSRQVTLHGAARRYRVWLPPGHDPSKPWPAILFLHGSGECGTDGEKPTAIGLGPELLAHPGRWPFVVVFPQKPLEEEEWEEREDLVLAVLDDATAAFGIDRSRVALAGMSQGGHGTWMIGARHPGRFAALVPICGYGRPHTVARRVAHLPVWAFHGLKDDVVDPQESRRIVEAIRAERRRLGLDPDGARLTLFPDANHGSWDPAVRTEDLPRWILGAGRSPGR